MPDLTFEFIGMLVVGGVVALGLYWGFKKEQREEKKAFREELDRLEKRIDEKLAALKSAHGKLADEVSEDRKEFHNQLTGATNGIARIEGTLINLNDTLAALRENKVDRKELG